MDKRKKRSDDRRRSQSSLTSRGEVTKHDYEVAPRFQNNPNVPGRRQNPQDDDDTLYEILIRPYKQPGASFYDVITSRKRKRVMAALRKENYTWNVPSDIASSMETMSTSGSLPTTSLDTSSVDTWSMQSVDPDRVSKASLEMEQYSQANVPTESVASQSGLLGAEGGVEPSELQPTGVSHTMEEHDYSSTLQESAQELLPQEYGSQHELLQSEQDTLMMPPPVQSYEEVSTHAPESQPKRPTKPMTTFRKGLTQQRHAKEWERQPEDPIGQAVIEGHKDMEKDRDAERQRQLLQQRRELEGKVPSPIGHARKITKSSQSYRGDKFATSKKIELYDEYNKDNCCIVS